MTTETNDIADRAAKAMREQMDFADRLAPDFPYHPREIFLALRVLNLDHDQEAGARAFLFACQRLNREPEQYAREIAFGPAVRSRTP